MMTIKIFTINLPRFVSARELQVSFDITTFEALQRKHMFSFVSRLLQFVNCLMANFMNSDAFYNSEYFKYLENACMPNTVLVSLKLLAFGVHFFVRVCVSCVYCVSIFPMDCL